MQESVHFYTKVYAYRHAGPAILEERNHSGDTQSSGASLSATLATALRASLAGAGLGSRSGTPSRSET